MPTTATGGSIAQDSSRRAVVIVAVCLIAIASFVIYRWRTSGFHWAVFLSTFQGVHWGWLLLGSLIILLTYLGRALRWQVMVRPIRPDSSLGNIFIATVIGFTAIVFFGRAGELVRPYLIAAKERVSFSSQMAAWLLERVLDLLMVLLIFGIALSQIPRTGLTPGPHLKTLLQAGGTIIGVAGVGCLGLLLAFRHFSAEMHRRLMSAVTFLPAPMQARISAIVSAFSSGFGATRSNTFIVSLLGYSILEWLFISGSFISIFRAFPVTARFSVTDIVIFMGFVALGSAIQIPGVGGGMQVAAILVLTELFGLSLEAASGFAVGLWILTFVLVVPFGVVLAFHEGLNWGNLRHASEESAP